VHEQDGRLLISHFFFSSGFRSRFQ